MPNIKFGSKTFANVENISVPLADGTGQASFGTGGELTGTNEQYHNLPEAVRKYLSEVTYDPTDYSVSKITEYVSGDSAEAYAVGLNLDVADEGVLNRDGYEQNVSAGINVVYNDIPGKKTPYTVSKNDKVIQCGSIEPLDRVRRIKCNTTNVRDLGGWICDGGTVRYGLLYRGGEVNVDDRDILLRQCGIRHDLNLRGADEATWSASPLGEDVHFTKADEFNWYSVHINDAWRTNLRCVFDAVTHNEPVLFHCAAGADRTGTLACVLEGLLGVSQSDIDKDYELTCFWTGVTDDNAARRRNEAEWKGLIDSINAFEGDTFRDKCVTFAAQLGFTADEINAYRKAMVDGSPEEVSPNIATYTVTSTLDDGVSMSNTEATAIEYQPYEATITPTSGYVISDVTVTMDGKNITNQVFKGTTTNLYRRVTTVLENCKTDNDRIKVIDGQGYVANITASDGYTLKGADVTITMGGIDVSKYYSNGKIAIPSVTGNIVITVKAVTGEDSTEEKTVTWLEGYGCNYNVGEKFGATAVEGYCATEPIEVTPGVEYTIEITDEINTDVSIRFVGGSDENLVTEAVKAVYSNSVKLYKFTPSEGTTKMILRGYLAQNVPTYTWKITFSGGAVATNLANPSDSNWATGYRINSSGGLTAADEWVTTNYISCKEGDVLRIKGIDLRNGDSSGAYFGRINLVDDSGDEFTQFYTGANYDESIKVYIRGQITDEDGVQTYTIALNGAGQNVKEYYNRDLAAVRLCGVLKGKAEDVVITINQEID